MAKPYKLYARKTWGSAIAETVLKMSGVQYEVEFFEKAELRDPNGYMKINPLGQVPSLRLPNGEIMTESLAICTYLAEKYREDLIPPPSSLHRAPYLRWSTFLVANIYPTATYYDYPERFIRDETAQKELRSSIGGLVQKMWSEMEKAAGAPWFLSGQMSLIDIYLAVMTFWEPGEEWFKTNAPRIWVCAENLRDTPDFKAVFANNTP